MRSPTGRIPGAVVALMLGAAAISGCSGSGVAGGATTSRPVPSATEPATTTTAPLPALGVSRRAMGFADRIREYRLYRPAAADGRRSLPLVILLHGASHTGDDVAADADLDARAERDGVVLAAPDGILGTWNAGRCCLWAVGLAVDDVGFLQALVGELAPLGVDAGRVAIAGFSNGGMLGYRFACERPEAVVAIVAISSTMATATPCTPARPVSILHLQGSADTFVSASGRSPLLPGGTGPTLAEVIATWRRIDACPPAGSNTRAGAAVDAAWTCGGGTTVELITIKGGTHVWPSLVHPPGSREPRFDGSGRVWAFLTTALGVTPTAEAPTPAAATSATGKGTQP